MATVDVDSEGRIWAEGGYMSDSPLWKAWPPPQSARGTICWVAVYHDWNKKVHVGQYYVDVFWGNEMWLFCEDEGQWKAKGSEDIKNIRGWQKMVPPEWSNGTASPSSIGPAAPKPPAVERCVWRLENLGDYGFGACGYSGAARNVRIDNPARCPGCGKRIVVQGEEGAK